MPILGFQLGQELTNPTAGGVTPIVGPVRDFAGDENGEWVVLGGDFAAVAGETAVHQGIRVRVGMFLSECYLDEEIGVDWIDSILVKNPDPLVVKALLQEQIADVPDVTNVVGTDLENDATTRDATIDYEVDTIYSEEPASGVVSVTNG